MEGEKVVLRQCKSFMCAIRPETIPLRPSQVHFAQFLENVLPLEASFPLPGSPWFPGNQIASEHRWQVVGCGPWSVAARSAWALESMKTPGVRSYRFFWMTRFSAGLGLLKMQQG